MTYRSWDTRIQKKRQRIGPRQQFVLFPPSFHHQRHVETQHEGHGNRFALLSEIHTDSFEHPTNKNMDSLPQIIERTCLLCFVQVHDACFQWFT